MKKEQIADYYHENLQILLDLILSESLKGQSITGTCLESCVPRKINIG